MNIKSYFKSGEAWIWLNAGAVAVSLIMVAGLIGLIAVKGMSYFWPKDVLELTVQQNGQTQVILGEKVDSRTDPAATLRGAGISLPDSISDSDMVERYSIKVGNKDLTGQDFVWVPEPFITQTNKPDDVVKLVRLEYGNFYGTLKTVTVDGKTYKGAGAYSLFEDAVERAVDLHEEISDIEGGVMSRLNAERRSLNMKERKLALENNLTEAAKQSIEAKRAEVEEKSLVH